MPFVEEWLKIISRRQRWHRGFTCDYHIVTRLVTITFLIAFILDPLSIIRIRMFVLLLVWDIPQDATPWWGFHPAVSVRGQSSRQSINLSSLINITNYLLLKVIFRSVFKDFALYFFFGSSRCLRSFVVRTTLHRLIMATILDAGASSDSSSIPSENTSSTTSRWQ